MHRNYLPDVGKFFSFSAISEIRMSIVAYNCSYKKRKRNTGSGSGYCVLLYVVCSVCSTFKDGNVSTFGEK